MGDPFSFEKKQENPMQVDQPTSISEKSKVSIGLLIAFSAILMGLCSSMVVAAFQVTSLYSAMNGNIRSQGEQLKNQQQEIADLKVRIRGTPTKEEVRLIIRDELGSLQRETFELRGEVRELKGKIERLDGAEKK